jgi:hypothetical protein
LTGKRRHMWDARGIAEFDAAAGDAAVRLSIRSLNK